MTGPGSGLLTSTAAVALLTGAGTGLGVLLLAVGWRGTVTDAATDDAGHGGGATRLTGWVRARAGRVAAAAGTGLLVLIVTRWIAAALGMAVLVGCFDTLFGGTGRARRATTRLEALAGWTESLRDLVATGIALPEALPASIAAAAPAIRPQLTALAERLAAREPVETALRALGDDLDDGSADLVVAALLLNSRAQGRALQAVLSALASSTRTELRIRRTIEAERRSTRRAVQIVIVVTVITALGLALGNPTYVAPYRTPAGQLMLGVVVAVFAAGFGWLARLSALPTTPRLLGPPTPVVGPDRTRALS